MRQTQKIGIIGDYDNKKPTHPATMEAIGHAASFLNIKSAVRWLPTSSFLTAEKNWVEDYDAFMASSGAPYESMEGAIVAIEEARKSGKPFVGT